MFTSSEKTIACGVTISSVIVSAMIVAEAVSSARTLLDAALHVEVAFRHVVVLAVENFLEAAHGVGDRDLPAFASGEHLRRAERLAEEALDRARAIDRLLVFGRQFVHAENRDDVLQILEPLQHLLHAAARRRSAPAPTISGASAREVEASGSTAG